MKFLIQKINNEIRHDFSFTLLESIRYNEWLGNRINVKYLNTNENDPICKFKPFHSKYVPIGSVEFVTQYINHFYGFTPKPINVPDELFQYVKRPIFNGSHFDVTKLRSITDTDWFIKSNDKIKGYKEIFKSKDIKNLILPEGNYQFSEYYDFNSEWRGFVYNGKLVGLQYYSGDFTKFPDIPTINNFISKYKSAPVAYTLDVSVANFNLYVNTDVIEVHDFFSCGLYGFSNHRILPNMHYRWFIEYLNRNNVTKLF